jgi:hypothetical protein
LRDASRLVALFLMLLLLLLLLQRRYADASIQGLG